MLQFILENIDGSWVDGVSACIAVSCALPRAVRPRMVVDRVIGDFLNGAALFPFLLMIASVLSTHVLKAVADSSRMAFFLSGGMGTIWIVGELKKP